MKRAISLICVIALAGFSGCSNNDVKRVVAKGKLLYQGAPLKVSEKASVTVRFLVAAENTKRRDSYTAQFHNADATFSVPGTDGRGIPVGKYKITIMEMLPEPTPEMQGINEAFDAAHSQIIRDVESDAPIVIDLSKPEG